MSDMPERGAAEPDWPVPATACDCHMHVFGPPLRYRGSQTRAYTPSECGLSRYEAAAAALGVRRVVLVQPSAYGTDNACMLEALRSDPQHFRGVAVIDPAAPEAELRELDRLGVRGIRLNLVTDSAPDTEAAQALVERVAARLRPLGWHLQIYAGSALLEALAPTLLRVGVDLVFDHMGGAHAAAGLEQSGFPTVLKMLANGECWVKLSGADRVSRSDTAFELAAPYARALIAANSHRLVWGTDWPHLGGRAGPRGDAAPPAIYRNLDDLALLRMLRDCVPDEATWQRILSDNPAQLYGF